MSIVDRRGFAASYLSVVVVMIAIGIISPHISLRTLEYMGLLGVALLTLGFMTARSIASFIHAPLMEKYTSRMIGSIGLALIVSTYMLYMILPPITYPLIKLIEGFASGLFWPLMQSLVVRSVAPNWRSRWTSIYFILGSVAGYAGVIAGSLIITLIGKEYIMAVGFGIGLGYLPIYYLVAPSKKIASNKKKPGLLDSLSETGRLGRIIPIILLVGGVNGLSKDYLFSYAKLLTGFSESTLRMYWSMVGYLGMALSLLFSHIFEATRHSRIAVSTGLLFLSTIILVPFIREPITFFIIVSLTLVGTRILRPIIRAWASNIASEPEKGIAVVNGFSNIAAGLVPLVIALFQTL